METIEMVRKKIEQATLPVLPERKEYRIGIIGTGFIVQNCHLVAYEKAGFNPYAITSLEEERSRELAEQFHIPKVYKEWKEMVDDPEIEIVDIAVPPHVQLEMVEYICKG